MPHPSGAWVHNLDPIILPIYGDIALRWYGLAYLAGILCGAWIVARWARRRAAPFAVGELPDFAYAIGIGMVLGGRLGYCTFYQPSLFVEFSSGVPFWGVFRVTDGGMASHGGILGLLAGAWWWARRHGRSVPVLVDAVAAVAPLGVFFGRVANFVNGELWGRHCAPDLPWAVVFPTELRAPLGLNHHATQAWQIAHAELLAPRHPSQLYAAILEGVIPFIIAMLVHPRHRRPGLTTGLVMALYALGRGIDECWREPDAGQPGSLGNALIFGCLTKGQALTIPVLLASVALMIWALRRPAQPDLYTLTPASTA